MAQINYRQSDGSFGGLYDVNLSKEDKSVLTNKLNELGIPSMPLDKNSTIANNIENAINGVYDATVEKGIIPESNSLTDIITAINGIKNTASGTLTIIGTLKAQLSYFYGANATTSKTATVTIKAIYEDGVVVSCTSTTSATPSASASKSDSNRSSAQAFFSINSFTWEPTV